MHAEYLKSVSHLHRSLFLTNAVRSFKGKPSYECRWGQGKNVGFEISVSYLCLFGDLGDFWGQLGGLKWSPLGYCFVCTVFKFLMGPFLNVILLAWLCVSRVCWIESGYSACVWAKCSCMLCKCFVFYFHLFISVILWHHQNGPYKPVCFSVYCYKDHYFYIVQLFIY